MNARAVRCFYHRDYYFPLPEPGWAGVTRWLGQSAAEVVRSSVDGAMSLDGLVSLWHAPASM